MIGLKEYFGNKIMFYPIAIIQIFSKVLDFKLFLKIITLTRLINKDFVRITNLSLTVVKFLS